MPLPLTKWLFQEIAAFHCFRLPWIKSYCSNTTVWHLDFPQPLKVRKCICWSTAPEYNYEINLIYLSIPNHCHYIILVWYYYFHFKWLNWHFYNNIVLTIYEMTNQCNNVKGGTSSDKPALITLFWSHFQWKCSKSSLHTVYSAPNSQQTRLATSCWA